MDLKPEWELLDVVACEKEMALYYVRNGDTRFYAFDVSPAYVERVKFGNYRKEVRSHRKFNLASDTVRKEAINLLRDMVRVGLVSCTNTYPVGGENGKRVRPIFPFLALNRRTDCKSIKFHQSELRELLVSSRFYGICVYVDITDAFMTIRCSSRASSCLGLFCPEIGEDLDGDLSRLVSVRPYSVRLLPVTMGP
ncbi:hypothetical protein FOZ60_004440 [Perkinsus olseni]|uniref:Uncharacterized protein n=1 Tax=Perkinsus olseni TaxID=32597 RepID=A0A7J6PN77_PEROL|nr:hypothetical protein FOZ60_004440 [Perkinsus olseni]